MNESLFLGFPVGLHYWREENIEIGLVTVSLVFFNGVHIAAFSVREVERYSATVTADQH
jgi:hypothetical protein